MQFSISIKGPYIYSQTFIAFVGLFIQIRPSKNEFSMYIPGENVSVLFFMIVHNMPGETDDGMPRELSQRVETGCIYTPEDDRLSP